MPLLFAHNVLILDANCVIGIYATRRMSEVLATIPRTVTIATYVFEKETQSIYGPLDEHGQRTKEPINLQPLVDAKLLRIVTIQSEAEAEIVVNLAGLIGDQGESITGAIAFHRDWAIGIDDRKARRLFAQYASHLQLIYTLDLVKYWFEINSPSLEDVASTLVNIRNGARYLPHRQHPLYEWWLSNGGPDR